MTSRRRRESVPTDRYAKAISAGIAAGRPPVLTPEFEAYLEGHPHEIFAAFDGLARHLPPAGEDGPLALGYLFVLQALLQRLRYRVDRGYTDAAELVASFQAGLAARAETEHLDPQVLAYAGGALHQSGIPVSPELAAASAKRLPAAIDGPLPPDVGLALRGVFEACNGDAFQVAGTLAELGHTMPEEARAALAAALPSYDTPDGRAVAVLFLLDPSPRVRRAVAGALVQAAAALSATDLRRLIAMRNWRPEKERAEVDAVVRKARAAGIECARWDAVGVETIRATAIDGAAGQVFLLLSPAGRKKRLSSILIKAAVADAWSGEPESRRRSEMSILAVGADTPMLAVSRAYLDRVVSHALALGIDEDKAAPLGLLQIAEAIGGADWQPAHMDFEETLTSLMAAIPPALRRPAAVTAVLQGSGELAGLDAFDRSWFEDDERVARIVATGGRGRGRAKLVNYLLQSVFTRRRRQWADLFVRTALWMREAPADADPCWRELAIVAKALIDGRDLSEIGLMRTIAARTIAALGGGSRRAGV